VARKARRGTTGFTRATGFRSRARTAKSPPAQVTFATHNALFAHTLSCSLGVYFTSENFPCAQSRETQFFNLAHPCLCLPGSAVKISFLGAWQRQTIDLDATEFSGMGARNDYYICVCEVRIFEGTATNKGEDRFEYQLGEGREGEEGVVIECRVKSGRRGQREK